MRPLSAGTTSLLGAERKKGRGTMQRITNKLLQPLEWQSKARCTEVDPEIFFPERGGSSKAARAVCAHCPVRANCLEYALNNKEQFGIWGGTSERERRRLRKERAVRRLRAAS
jgi:WhiB family transcriptional regulator, redox-sensing transcriptional regulator